jgi:hypothetical protein
LLKEKKLNLPPSPLKGRAPERGELIFLFSRPYVVKFINPTGTEIRLGLVPEELRAMADDVMVKAEQQYQDGLKAAAEAQKAEEKIANKRPRRKAPKLVIDDADGGTIVLNARYQQLQPGDAVVVDGLPGIPLPVRKVHRGTRVEPDKVG